MSHDHGTPARHGRGFTRRATYAVVVIAVAVSTGLLAGCENPDRSLRLTLVNNTDQYLRIRVGNELNAFVEAGATEDAALSYSSAYCVSGVNAVTRDGALTAEHSGEVCHEDTWVIEQSDLVPVEDADKTPTPSP